MKKLIFSLVQKFSVAPPSQSAIEAAASVADNPRRAAAKVAGLFAAYAAGRTAPLASLSSSEAEEVLVVLELIPE